MRNERLLTSYRIEKGVGRMEKREIDELEPYLEKRGGFMWLPQSDTDYHAAELSHKNRKSIQDKHDLINISDYLCWSIGNFVLFFVLGVICIILSVRVRECKRSNEYDKALKLSQRTLAINIFTTIAGVCFVVTMLALLIKKSSSNF